MCFEVGECVGHIQGSVLSGVFFLRIGACKTARECVLALCSAKPGVRVSSGYTLSFGSDPSALVINIQNVAGQHALAVSESFVQCSNGAHALTLSGERSVSGSSFFSPHLQANVTPGDGPFSPLGSPQLVSFQERAAPAGH